MLRSLNDLERYKVSATDGDIGRVSDFLLDDERWVVRHLVVETRGFLDERQVLISPISFRDAEWSSNHFHLALTKDKIKNSPSVELDKPVSRQHEREYYSYYGYPYYWGYGTGLWGMGPYPRALAAEDWTETSTEGADKAANDVHLRSAKELCGYHIDGTDGAIGHLDDFIVDDESWALRYLVIDTSNWWVGKKVLVAPNWASSISWDERSVSLDMSRQAIKNSPEWNGAAAVNREYEARLYDYYGRPVYWGSGDRPKVAQRPQHRASRPG
jgi:sporulation protein YlmC with PRC-barrel domain